MLTCPKWNLNEVCTKTKVPIRKCKGLYKEQKSPTDLSGRLNFAPEIKINILHLRTSPNDESINVFGDFHFKTRYIHVLTHSKGTKWPDSKTLVKQSYNVFIHVRENWGKTVIEKINVLHIYLMLVWETF